MPADYFLFCSWSTPFSREREKKEKKTAWCIMGEKGENEKDRKDRAIREKATDQTLHIYLR